MEKIEPYMYGISIVYLISENSKKIDWYIIAR